MAALLGPRSVPEAWTIFILIEAAEIHQAYDIGTLLSRMPGPVESELPRRSFGCPRPGALGRAAPPAVNAVIWSVAEDFFVEQAAVPSAHHPRIGGFFCLVSYVIVIAGCLALGADSCKVWREGVVCHVPALWAGRLRWPAPGRTELEAQSRDFSLGPDLTDAS